MASVAVTAAIAELPGIDAHPHARAVLAPVLRGAAAPSHAYLFHGPSGTGKRSVARAFAAALLAEGAPDPVAVAERVKRGAHPDLTWVTPSGATEMLVADIEEPVVAAAARTPFESTRRVFVIEDAHMLNDQAANRMLKTLEEPPAFVHLLLLTDRPEEVLPTIASRCQHVRFDPLPPELIADRIKGGPQPSAPEQAAGERTRACARLALGDARRARELASEAGEALRAGAESFVRAAIAGHSEQRPWLELLDLARAAGARAGRQVEERIADELELLPAKERKRHQREGEEALRREERRARTRTLDLGLALAELWLRDLLCICEGAPELIYAVDRRAELEEDTGACSGTSASGPGAAERAVPRLREAVALVQDVRLRLTLNVSEELALEALAYRLQALLA
jgi:DNA polymerase-3 subunit delta'